MRKSLFLTMILVSNAALGMQNNFVSPDELLANSPEMPVPLFAAASDWFDDHQGLCEFLISFGATAEPAGSGYYTTQNKSNSNYVFPLSDNSGVVKMAGFSNVFRETLSTLGRDPYSLNATEGLGNLEAIKECARNRRRFQAVSALAYYRFLSREGSPILRAPRTFAFQIPGGPSVLDDRNYVVVQEALPASVVSLESLPELERKAVIDEMDPNELYAVLKKVGLWNLHRGNLLVDRENLRQLWVTDLEKPNNEGFGEQAKWQVAVFGSGSQSDDPWKWGHNTRVGHGEVAGILSGNTEKHAQWLALLADDPDL